MRSENPVDNELGVYRKIFKLSRSLTYAASTLADSPYTGHSSYYGAGQPKPVLAANLTQNFKLGIVSS